MNPEPVSQNTPVSGGRAESTAPASVLAPQLRQLTVGVIVSVAIMAFDGLGVTTALPRIASELDGLATYGWAISALMLASVVGTVIGGFIADRRGPRRPFVAGFVVFVAGLAQSASAPSWELFLLGRTVQGLGVGAIMSMAYVIVAIAYPRRLQARALALLSGAWTVPALIGPLASSALTEAASWRFLFVGLIPLAVTVGALTLPGVPRLPSGESSGSGGLPRQLVFSIGLAVSAGLVLAGLEQRSLAALAVMVLIGGAAMIFALRQVTPPGTLSARRGVPAGIATRAALSMAFFGIETFLPLAITELRGASLLVAGLAVAAGALVWVAGSMLQSRRELRQGIGTRRADSIFGLGALGIGIGVIAVTLLGEVLPVWVAIIGWVIGGFGMGLAYNATTAETFGQTEPEAIGQMSGTIQMAQTLGTAVIAGAGTALIAWAGDARGLASAMTAIFALTGLLAIVTMPLALRIRRPDRPAIGQVR